jgi:hypothetical protein
MIEFAGEYVDEIGDTGEALFKLTEKGVAYVVEHGLESEPQATQEANAAS